MGRTCQNGAQDFVFSGDTGYDSQGGVAPVKGEDGALAVRSLGPNPAQGAARLAYSIPRECGVEIRIVATDGRTVRTLYNGWQTAGPHQVSWDGRDQTGRPLGQGLYWARIRAGSESLSQKIVVLK